jgi:hypothetical protein
MVQSVRGKSEEIQKESLHFHLELEKNKLKNQEFPLFFYEAVE